MKKISIIFVLTIFIMACGTSRPNENSNSNSSTTVTNSTTTDLLNDSIDTKDSIFQWIRIEKDIKVKNYFPFMDKLVERIDTFDTWRIDEYILVHANPWIVDSLRSFDYYDKMGKGVFIYDQSELVILHQGDSLAIPDSSYAHLIQSKLATTVIDVNLPEFVLRIYQNNDTILTCPVRVGRDAEKFIYVVGHVVNLKTPIGVGEIVRTDRMHKVINLDTGKEYPGTNRDDGKFTKMPIIPWIEPSINGVRYGAMIHPTTNPTTLGKAYSHGCVGTKEKDAWTIYYNAPVGTRVIFRYDLKIIGEKGDTVLLNDIYHLFD